MNGRNLPALAVERFNFGYNVVSLFVDGVKVAACNGGGYDVNYPRLKAGACHDGNIVRID